MSEFYTIEDVAAVTGLTDRTLRSYLKEGRLTGTKVEGAWRFGAEDVAQLFQNSKVRQGRGSARAILVGPTAVVQALLTDG